MVALFGSRTRVRYILNIAFSI